MAFVVALPAALSARGRRHPTRRIDMSPRAPRSCASSPASQPAPSAVPVPAALSRLRVVALGACCMDMVATVAAYPAPDSKVRSTSAVECGGGNAANAATAARRLGVPTALLSVVGDDARGAAALDELARDGVDVSRVVRARGATTAFSYVIVDAAGGTRTCVHTPSTAGDAGAGAWGGDALAGASVGVLGRRHGAAAAAVARAAVARGVPVLVDAERPRAHLDELLALADYVVASAAFPLAAHPGAAGFEDALGRVLGRGRARWVLATRGAAGATLVRRAGDDGGERGARDRALVVTRRAPRELPGLEVLACPAWPAERVVDTTGAGDAFVGAVAYALCVGLGVDAMLGLATRVAARKVAGAGARSALPRRDELDPALLTPMPKL